MHQPSLIGSFSKDRVRTSRITWEKRFTWFFSTRTLFRLSLRSSALGTLIDSSLSNIMFLPTHPWYDTLRVPLPPRSWPLWISPRGGQSWMTQETYPCICQPDRGYLSYLAVVTGTPTLSPFSLVCTSLPVSHRDSVWIGRQWWLIVLRRRLCLSDVSITTVTTYISPNTVTLGLDNNSPVNNTCSPGVGTGLLSVLLGIFLFLKLSPEFHHKTS